MDRTLIRAEYTSAKIRFSEEIRVAERDTKQKLTYIQEEMDQKIFVMRDEASKYEYNLNLEREGLILDTGNLKGQLESAKKDLDHYQRQLQNRIDSIKELHFDQRIDLDLKPNLLNKVTMPKETFEELKMRAESAEKMQRALRISEERNKTLEKNNRELENLRGENFQLKRQVDFLKQAIEKIKVFMTTLVKHEFRLTPQQMDQVVGFAKFQAKDRLGRNQDVDLQNDLEKKGFDHAKAVQEEFRKERQKDSLDMER